MRNIDDVLNSDSILRHIDVQNNRDVNGVLHCLTFESTHRSQHWESELTNLCLVDLSVEHNGQVDWHLICRDLLFDVDEVNLREVDWVLFGGHDLVQSKEVNLRDVNWVFISGNNLFNSNEMDLWQFDGLFQCF